MSSSDKKHMLADSVPSQLKHLPLPQIIPSIVDRIPYPYQQPNWYDSYQVHEIPEFLSNEQCNELIAYAKTQQMLPTRIYDKSSRKFVMNSSLRHSEQVIVQNSLSDKIYEMVSKVINMPINNMETLKIIHYPISGKHCAHHDFAPNTNTIVSSRFFTVIIYLNDDFEGGCTEFPKINHIIKPEKGKAVLFWLNLHTEVGTLRIEDSIHLANEITKGEKWVTNVWIHDKALL